MDRRWSLHSVTHSLLPENSTTRHSRLAKSDWNRVGPASHSCPASPLPERSGRERSLGSSTTTRTPFRTQYCQHPGPSAQPGRPSPPSHPAPMSERSRNLTKHYCPLPPHTSAIKLRPYCI